MSDKKLLIKLAADVEQLKSGLRKASSDVDQFSKNMSKIGGAAAAAFSVRTIGAFLLDVVKLSGEAQGVSEAFEKLPKSIALMNELKKATGGTVAELDLMKRAVMASNFDISLEALPRLLEFATIRAKQTGQSVDYLVDSIVTGIGRKSKLILDNLGISAVQLTEALGGASAASSSIEEVANAVGKIAEENLQKMGSLSENASTKIERLNASWVNLKVALGDAANGAGVLGSAMDSLTDDMDLLASKNISFWQKIAALAGGPGVMAGAQIADIAAEARKLVDEQKLAASVTKQAQQAISTFGHDLEAIKSAYKQNINFARIYAEVQRIFAAEEKAAADAIRNEKNLTEQLNTRREEATLAIGKERAELNKEIQVIEKEIAALQKLGLEKQKQAKALNFNGLRGTALPSSAPNAKANLADTFAHPNMGASGAQVDTQMLEDKFAKLEEARRIIQDLAPITEKSLKAVSEAFKKFQKDGDMEAFTDSLDLVQKKQDDMLTASVAFGDAFGEAFGNVISGAQTMAQAFAKMAVEVITQIQRIVLANMIANASKYGIVGIGLAAAGFALVKALFSRISKTSASPSASSSSFSSPRGSMNLMAKVSGKDLVFVLNNQQTMDSRVKVAY